MSIVVQRGAVVQVEDVERRVLKARIRLGLTQPFLATAVMRLPLVKVGRSSWCQTAATDGYHVFYNPQWMGALKDEEIRGVLAHEVLHVLFAHADRKGTKDRKAWNVACDFAINFLLKEQGFRLPKGGLLAKEFGHMTAEEIYRELGFLEAVTKKRGKSSGQIKGEKPEDLGSGEAGEVPTVGGDLVDHDDPRVRPLRNPDAPDPEQLEELRKELRDEALSRLQGNAAAAFANHCNAAGQRRVDWRALLRAWLSQRIKGDWVSYPFSKRHVHRGLFMPSPGMAVPGHVVFAIDTSGSMSDGDVGGIVTELRAFRETFPSQLTVLQADADVQSVVRYDAMDGMEIPKVMRVLGRGGTSFEPIFRWVKANAPDAIVLYATDGWGAFPPTAPPNPVIWLLTQDGSPPERFPFGSVVKVS